MIYLYREREEGWREGGNPNSFRWDYKLSPSLSARAVHHIDHKHPETNILDGQIPATKAHMTCCMPENGMKVPTRKPHSHRIKTFTDTVTPRVSAKARRGKRRSQFEILLLMCWAQSMTTCPHRKPCKRHTYLKPTFPWSLTSWYCRRCFPWHSSYVQ